jgi:hypothetical protein
MGIFTKTSNIAAAKKYSGRVWRKAQYSTERAGTGGVQLSEK